MPTSSAIFTGRDMRHPPRRRADLLLPVRLRPTSRTRSARSTAIGLSDSRIFGFQVLDHLGHLRPARHRSTADGTRWQLLARLPDASAARPWAPSSSSPAGPLRLPEQVRQPLLKAYGIYDSGVDILGGDRGTARLHRPEHVGADHASRLARPGPRPGSNVQDLPDGFTVQAQARLLSDRNFLEQYYNDEFDNDLNQETFALRQAAARQLGLDAPGRAAHPRSWVTETEWLPKADGYLLGQKFFDLFTYNAARQRRLRPAPADRTMPAFAYQPTDVRTDTGRFDVMQDLSLPFYARRRSRSSPTACSTWPTTRRT